MKFRSHFLVVAVSLCLVANGCTGDQNATRASSDATAVAEAQAESASQPTLAEGVISTIVSAYLKLKDALVASDDEMAKEQASEIVAALEAIEGERVKEILGDARAIAGSGELEVQREHFDHLSENVYSVVKASQGVTTPLYKQYCPMAFNNEGAFWLSNSEEVRNPYFGDRMLTCGKVEEKIN